MSAMKVTGVDEDAVEFVLPRFRPISRLVKEFIKVNFEREFKSIVDLCGGVRMTSMPRHGY